MKKGDCVFVFRDGFEPSPRDEPGIVHDVDNDTITVNMHPGMRRMFRFKGFVPIHPALLLSRAKNSERAAEKCRKIYAVWCGEHLDPPTQDRPGDAEILSVLRRVLPLIHAARRCDDECLHYLRMGADGIREAIEMIEGNGNLP